MNNVIVSISENILKVSLEGKQFLATSKVISSEIVNDSEILNVEEFSKQLSDCIQELTNLKGNKLSLNFLVEPKNTILKFVTASKNGTNLDEQIINEVKDKLDGANIDEFYYSYQKIAPFFYQFIAVKKDHVEKIFEVSNTLSIPLTSVLSWLTLLPKYLNKSEPAIFVYKTDNAFTIALSELNGIYFKEIYTLNKIEKEIKELIKTLAGYKRASHIKKVYTINDAELKLEENFEVVPLYFAPDNIEEHAGFDLHFLVRNCLNSAVDVGSGQSNILNMLPLPVVQETKSKVPAVVMTIIGALVIGAGAFGGYTFLNNRNSQAPTDQIATDTTNQPAVLSETNQSTESTPSVEIRTDLKKEDLKVRVENATQTSGLASKTRDYLNDKGFVIQSVGNATDERETTVIQIKPSMKDYGPILVEAMKDDYKVSVEETLPEDEDYDALVLVGLE